MQIVLRTDPGPADVEAVRAPLRAFNARTSGHAPDYHPFVFHILDAGGQPIGGATGHAIFDWVFLELLFVPEALRGQGVGGALLARVEQFGREHGMAGVWLDTFSFQARPFYERHGYTLVGTIEDHPVGGARHFLSKRLDSAAA